MRYFPPTDKDLLLDFSYITNRMERIAIPIHEVKQTAEKSGTPNCYIVGQLTAINLIKRFATEDDLIPEETSYAKSLDHLSFLKRIHLNVMKPISQYQEKMEIPNPYPVSECGQWRYTRKFIIDKEMPSPYKIQEHLFNWLQDLIDFQNNLRHKIETPNLLEEEDLALIVEQCYKSHLQLCCIKPFTDGSNRVARLVEQMLRMNFGLPWKILRFDETAAWEPYIEDIREMQTNYLPD